MKLNITAAENALFIVVRDVADRLQQEVYAVGGFVRDRIMGNVSRDIDFVTVGDGTLLAQEVCIALGPDAHGLSVFKNFGTAMFHYKDLELEFVGARKESYSHHSRKPEVQQGTIYEDQPAKRFYNQCVSTVAAGGRSIWDVIDPLGGIADIEAKRIITPLDPVQTFSDDPLRMMRGIRVCNPA